MNMSFKNFPMVSRVIFGRGSFNQLYEIISPKRQGREAPFIYYVDNVFKGNHWLTSRVTLSYKDKIIYVPTTEEPKTEQIDQLVEDLILEWTIHFNFGLYILFPNINWKQSLNITNGNCQCLNFVTLCY